MFQVRAISPGLLPLPSSSTRILRLSHASVGRSSYHQPDTTAARAVLFRRSERGPTPPRNRLSSYTRRSRRAESRWGESLPLRAARRPAFAAVKVQAWRQLTGPALFAQSPRSVPSALGTL